jgi:uncharacterized protein with FMN-binding domain
LSAQKGLKGSLTALGTAAVLGIYSAGYALTEEAAQRLEEPLGTLLKPPLSPVVEVEGVTEAPPIDPVGPAAPSPEVAATATTPVDPPASAPVPTSPANPVATATATASPADSEAVEAPAASPYRDGVYTSRGYRTRHGDIEATVEISGGRIVSATVFSCGMLWPCSDIDRIIPRVVARQSTAIGIVSGATQSSEAFITAVDAALTLAMNSTP